MAIRDIRIYPDPILKRVSRPVERVDDSIRRLLDDMAETMYSQPGIGLAAPQVGVLLRVVVVDVSSREKNGRLMGLINPEVVWSEGSLHYEEGCLSVPGMTVEMERKERIQVVAQDRDGSPVEIRADGLLAIALQHELDHLEGKLIIDKVSRLRRDLYRRKMKKAAAG